MRQSTLLSLSHHLEIPTLFPPQYWVLYGLSTLLPASLIDTIPVRLLPVSVVDLVQELIYIAHLP